MGLRASKALQADDPAVGIAWVAMRRTLLDQVVRDNLMVGAKNLVPISAFDSHIEEKMGAFEKVVLVLDEAHHSAADTCVALWDICNPAFTIGLSATPMRTDNLKLCFQRIIQEAGYHRLIQDGYLSPYAHWQLDEYTPRSVAEAYFERIDTWGRTAIFFRTSEECYECQSLLLAGGVTVEVVTASTDRERQLADFESGKLDVLINMMVLSEGWDCPSLATVFVRDSDKGPTIQMAGRVLRKFPGLPLKNIVQSKHTGWNFGRTAMPQISYSKAGPGLWLSLTPNTKLLLEAIREADRKMNTQTFTLDPKSQSSLGGLRNKAARAKRARKLAATAVASLDEAAPDFVLGEPIPTKRSGRVHAGTMRLCAA